MRQFLWGSIKKKPKKGRVGWKKVNLPKEGGGAGILKSRDHVEKNIHIQVNSSDRCLFWKDVWLNGQSLKSLFPNLFSLSRLQDATIQEMIDRNAGDSLKFAFCRSLKDSEIEDVAHLLDLLSTFNCGVGADHRIWQNGTKTFSVSECYKSLEDEGLLLFPYKCVWNPKIPYKVILSVWSLCYDAAPTMDTLRNSYNVNGCLLCKRSAESNHHLFLHCEVTREIWYYFLGSYNLQWVFQETVRNTILERRKKKGRNLCLRTKIWDIIPFAIWWAVWLERNARVFNGKYNSVENMKDSVKAFIYNWCVGTSIFEGITLNMVLSNWEAVVH
ncbi:uncharacterized protein LOC113325040 [Papaver somniferum]|uniref:uncharacterized protein LOC113325040 n=1 Tax=Papaver somniferum TaxID=3469 RepID=UPI000E704CEB|nr:uncharacterized protein LOC113325040 [Papaver somniferum]